MPKKKHNPIHPGEVLWYDFMEPMGITKYRLAKDTGMPADRVGRIVHGTRSVTGDTALRLARFFGTSASFWMNLQARYDLDTAADEVGRQIEKQVRPWRAA